jgi:hypothetical protein
MDKFTFNLVESLNKNITRYWAETLGIDEYTLDLME